MRERRASSWLIAGICALWFAGPSSGNAIDPSSVPGAVIEGAVFPGSLDVDRAALRLHAAGLLRWLFFNGYAAALYLGEGATSAQVLSDVPKRLELHYFRSIPASLFGNAAQKILERNVRPEALARLQASVDRLAGWYVDVEPGDRYALSYLPGVGTHLEHNGNRLGTIPGADFGAAYFAIWLGADPIDAPLRDQLLRAR